MSNPTPPNPNLPTSLHPGAAPVLDGSADVMPPQAFNSVYAGAPPWDIGKTQPALAKVFDSGEIVSPVLDAGCGSGEHAIDLAARGYAVLGIDFAPAAIAKAQEKAGARRSAAEFKVHDALNLRSLNRTFNTVIDSGLLHCFSDENRKRYVSELAAVLNPGGRAILMVFSEKETRPGPRRVTQAELHAAFADGWRFNYINDSAFESTMHEGGAKAWLVSVQRE
jgi:SAM-dependent methyltransferase